MFEREHQSLQSLGHNENDILLIKKNFSVKLKYYYALKAFHSINKSQIITISYQIIQ